MIIAIKTDKPDAELYVLTKDGEIVSECKWEAGRDLTLQILSNIESVIKDAGGSLPELSAVTVFKGPGSFTGLRIGITVANTLSYAQNVPIVAASGDDWLRASLVQIDSAKPGNYVLPYYDSEPNITTQKK